MKKLPHGGTTANLYKLVCDGLILSQYECLRKYHIIPHKWLKINVSHSGNVISRLRRNVKSQLFAKWFEIVSPTIWENSVSRFGAAISRFRRIEMPPNFGVNLQLNIVLIRESCSGLSF